VIHSHALTERTLLFQASVTQISAFHVQLENGVLLEKLLVIALLVSTANWVRIPQRQTSPPTLILVEVCAHVASTVQLEL